MALAMSSLPLDPAVSALLVVEEEAELSTDLYNCLNPLFDFWGPQAFPSTQIHVALDFTAGRATGGPVFRTTGQTAPTPDPSGGWLLPQRPLTGAPGHTRGPRLGRAHRAAIVRSVPGTLSFA